MCRFCMSIGRVLARTCWEGEMRGKERTEKNGEEGGKRGGRCEAVGNNLSEDVLLIKVAYS